MDDLLLCSPSLTHSQQHTIQLLNFLAEQGDRASPTKVQLSLPRITHLGVLLTPTKRYITTDRKSLISTLPLPTLGYMTTGLNYRLKTNYPFGEFFIGGVYKRPHQKGRTLVFLKGQSPSRFPLINFLFLCLTAGLLSFLRICLTEATEIDLGYSYAKGTHLDKARQKLKMSLLGKIKRKWK